MNDHEPTLKQDAVVLALRELVDALGRRVAQVERVGEAGIAREATALRAEALKRIHELTSASQHDDTREVDQNHAVMTDDGGSSERSR